MNFFHNLIPQMIASFLKRNGLFFAVLFFVWMGIVFVLNAGHRYFPSPLPNELPAMQAERSNSRQQGEPAAPPVDPGAR